MSKNKKDITILTIGDKKDFDSYQKFDREKKSFLKNGFHYLTADYHQFLRGRSPKVDTGKIVIFLFFPFSDWNKHIEHKNYKGIYGSRILYRKFVRYWERVENRIKRKLSGKDILFINDPRLCGTCRDKSTVSKKLTKFDVSQPRRFKTSTIKGVQKKLDQGRSLYLKPQFGSMGKGITYLSKSNWKTNFLVKESKIIKNVSDHGWTFSDITGNHKVLKQLLKSDILIEEAIEPLVIKGHKVELRIYVFYNKVIYIYPKKNKPERIITNISQGGRGDPKLLEILPPRLISRAKREAVRVAKALNIAFVGIDIVLSRNLKDVYVVDVNAFAGLPKRRIINLARMISVELGRLHDNGKLFNTVNEASTTS